MKVKTQPTEEVVEAKTYTGGGMLINNQVLNEIQKTILDLRDTEMWCIGTRISAHASDPTDSVQDLAEAVYKDCKSTFKRVEQIERDLDKLAKAQDTIRSLRYVYLGIF